MIFMAIKNVKDNIFFSNIKKLARSMLFRMRSPILSKFLLKIISCIENEKYDENDHLKLLSKVSFKTCSLFECILIYTLLRIFYERKDKPTATDTVSFSDNKPRTMDDVRTSLAQINNQPFYSKLCDIIRHRFFGETSMRPWKNAMNKFKKLVMSGSLKTDAELPEYPKSGDHVESNDIQDVIYEQ